MARVAAKMALGVGMAFSVSATTDTFQEQVQSALETVVENARVVHGYDLAMTVGWKDSQHDFNVAAGSVNATNDPAKRRKASPADTFLYGSGTKPFTAVGIMRLIDQGKLKARDKVSKYIDPFLLRNNGTTMEGLFGAAITNATVLDLIEMSAGISDYEVEINHSYPFDAEILKNGDKVWPPYATIRYAANAPNQTGPGGHILCEPGKCREYSSTSYQVAGLLLASVLNPDGDWVDLDQATAIFPDASRFPSFKFLTDVGRLRDHLTVPGTAVGGMWDPATIYDQNPSILGWTCGNLVGTTQDVGRFFYDLFDANSTSKIISAAAQDTMKQSHVMTTGWGAGHLSYGAGIMILDFDQNKGHYWGKGPLDWGYTFGHGGDTYGFQSIQGYTPTLRAGWSIVMNSDSAANYAATFSCFLMQIAIKELAKVDYDLNCQLPHAAAIETVYV